MGTQVQKKVIWESTDSYLEHSIQEKLMVDKNWLNGR